MSDLIEALKIFLRYGNLRNPTHCEHDVLSVMINPAIVSDEDKKALEALGFEVDEAEGNNFYSFRFGSA